MDQVKLWRKNSLGLGEWRIWHEGATIHYAHRTVEGGAEVSHSDVARTNQSGRSIDAQVELEINSRVSRQLDKGYKRSREEAVQGSTNQLGLVNPMLAQPIEKVSMAGVTSGYVQPKLDGHRMLVRVSEDGIVAYTRKGKLIDTVDHITAEFAQYSGPDFTLDGELYVHGERLQGISSLIKRKQPGTERLTYNVYDICDHNLPYGARYTLLRSIFESLKLTKSILVETTHLEQLPTDPPDVDLMYRIKWWFDHYRKLGYEGAMFRRSIRGYEDAKRSDQLLKVKAWLDDEGTCVAIKPSKDGWAICTLELANGKRFDISAPGTFAEKIEVLINAGRYIGRPLTFDYATLTADGMPFHASALRWRDDL